MDYTNLISLTTLAFSLGIVHALDADHVITVSGLASTRANPRDSIQFCLRWALGHGVSLLAIGSCVYLFGMAIPDELSHYAEHAVGVVLIMIGLFVLFDLLRKNAHLHFHQHDGLPEHAHWHTHHGAPAIHRQDPHRHHHSAVLVGVLHGTAGSAPLLVLIPLAKIGSPLYGVTYLLVFSAGVLVTMLVFGGILGGIYQWLSKWGTRSVKMLRFFVATSAIAFGSYLLSGA